MYGYCLPAAFNLAEPSAETAGLTTNPVAVSSELEPRVIPAARYGAEVGLGSVTAASGLVLSLAPAIFLTVVPPQGGCGCPPPPKDHACSCWAVAMFPVGTALGASAGILLTDYLLLPDRRHGLLPPLIGSLAAAAIVTAMAGPAYANGDLSVEVFVPTLAVSTAISGTLTNALLGPKDGRDHASERPRSTRTTSNKR